MEEEKWRRLKEAFGDDSSDSEPEQQVNIDFNGPSSSSSTSSILGENPNWQSITQIKGLWLCTNFLSSQQHSSLLSLINQEGWFIEASHNQAMRFGDLPAWATELSVSIKEIIQLTHCVSEPMDTDASVFPYEFLWRDPLFDQLIVNVYQPGEGICAHVDLMRFEDGIAIVSLESSCVMHFSRVEAEACSSGAEASKIPVYLTPGSLVLMWGEARYKWKHEINRKPENQRWEGQTIDQQRRTSITLRKLCRSE